MSKKNPTTIVLAYPDSGAGNDQEPLWLAVHHQGQAFLQQAIWGQ